MSIPGGLFTLFKNKEQTETRLRSNVEGASVSIRAIHNSTTTRSTPVPFFQRRSAPTPTAALSLAGNPRRPMPNSPFSRRVRQPVDANTTFSAARTSTSRRPPQPTGRIRTSTKRSPSLPVRICQRGHRSHPTRFAWPYVHSRLCCGTCCGTVARLPGRCSIRERCMTDDTRCMTRYGVQY